MAYVCNKSNGETVKRKKKPNGHWTKVRCHSEAMKYSSRSEFSIKSKSAYVKASMSGWLGDICSHMKRPIKAPKWTKDLCHSEALKYETKGQFEDGSQYAYTTACKNGFIDDICGHMQHCVIPTATGRKKDVTA